ncbi:MAG: glycyl-radical enzyme activating protein [Lentisphaeria bacterium]|nr:glycyl-radical enzyme activating protein [Lentisphaeria bacterium]
MRGAVTSIQRFSLNDGPGIRTTVFLKGCNLRCAWCHNPETIRRENELLFHPEKCIGCRHCAAVCPSGARGITAGEPLFDPERCTGCGSCAEICFPGATETAARLLSVDEAMAEIMQDLAYYRDSGGGVTLSGGEAFCQPEFAEALLDGCRAETISTAAETNLFWQFGAVRPALEKLDLIMFDLKLFDAAAHRRWTGAGNRTILENAKRLDGLGVPLIARTPLVPGVTDSGENIAAISRFLSGFRNLQYYELLNFNPLGDSKFRALRKENPFAAARPLSAEAVRRLLKTAGEPGITVKAG